MNARTQQDRTDSLFGSVPTPSLSRRRAGVQAPQPLTGAPAASLRAISDVVRREGPMPPDRAIRLVRRAAQAAAVTPVTGRREERSWVFALGVMLFLALTGRAPSDALLPTDLSSPPPPSAFSPFAVHPSLDAIVRTCLAGGSDDGFASAAELNIALSALSIGQSGTLDHTAARA